MRLNPYERIYTNQETNKIDNIQKSTQNTKSNNMNMQNLLKNASIVQNLLPLISNINKFNDDKTQNSSTNYTPNIPKENATASNTNNTTQNNQAQENQFPTDNPQLKLDNFLNFANTPKYNKSHLATNKKDDHIETKNQQLEYSKQNLIKKMNLHKHYMDILQK